MERDARIELALSAWEAEVLPLNESRVEEDGEIFQCLSANSGAGCENRTRLRLASAGLEGRCPANGPTPLGV